MFKRILLAYDGTVEGARALREGALLAKACGAEVFLLSVVPGTAGMMIAESVQCGAAAKQTEVYRDLLERAVAQLKAFGFKPTAWLAEGEPTPTIATLAKDICADLVVVGHHNRGFLSRWWSGSRQDYLSDHLTCSVLVARNAISDEEFEARMRAV
ncbi:MAG: universal stress protein [Rhizomicrobium sp.]|jgi:nucleotide-binding universal stress UspA family protein